MKEKNWYHELVDLFGQTREEKTEKKAPLAERLRPKRLSEFVGQKHILGEGKLLSVLIKRKEIPSMILWGPSGCGKTTLGYIIASEVGFPSFFLSAVNIGVKEVREIIRKARTEKVLLFLDEFHRFNKLQQDTFLPYVEKGKVILIGATTENPSFEIIRPLLSRMEVIRLNPLSEDEIFEILNRAKNDPEFKMDGIETNEEVLRIIATLSDGDARKALNIFEVSHVVAKEKNLKIIDFNTVSEAYQTKVQIYDKKGDMHYWLISAFIKSMRGSDPDASLYWLMRMLEAGEDPLFIARRMIIFASEDVGCADPYALTVAVAAKEAFEFVGAPEGYLALAQACIYLSLCEKSNSVYNAVRQAQKDVRELPHFSVPVHLRTAPTKIMRDLGYGRDYLYPHDFENGIANQTYMPQELIGRRYYFPTQRGYEAKIKEYLEKAKRIINTGAKGIGDPGKEAD
ncbi:MAG: replication-associated recombination protein A [Deltaproteobacteria bacterium]|nr:replication-associated recombination protein A [Deltaproteobacteria bacterium]